MRAQALETGNDLQSELYKTSHEGVAGTLVMSSDGIVRTITEDIFRYEGNNIVKV